MALTERAPSADGATSEALCARVTDWTAGRPGRAASVDAARRPDTVRFYEIGRDAGPSEVMAALGPHCPGLEAAMVDDLVTPDEEPCGTSYGDGRIRLASTFRVMARRTEPETGRGKKQRAGILVFE